MNKRITIYLSVLLSIVLIILGLLIGLKIDYYEPLPFEIRDDSIYLVLTHEPSKVFVNVNSKVFTVTNWSYVDSNLYILDFNINKDINDKVFCYITSYRLNYLSYIFKVVFNI